MISSRRLARVTPYSVSLYYCGRTVLIVLIMEEEEEMVGRQFYSFQELKALA